MGCRSWSRSFFCSFQTTVLVRILQSRNSPGYYVICASKLYLELCIWRQKDFLEPHRKASIATTTAKMPSAYKSVVNQQDSSDDDMSDDGVFLDTEESGAESSSTVQAESTSESGSDEEPTPKKSSTQLPLELKNRILLLTSRGVSSRQVSFARAVASF